MKLVIQGKNIDVTDALREYVGQKIERAVNHFQNMTTEVDVHLSVARNPRITPKQTAEVTIYVNGSVIRAEESSENLYASIDLVADKIARQLRKYKEKRQGKNHAQPKTGEILEGLPVASGSLLADRTPVLPAEVIRTKYFAMPPMTVHEALEHLEMIGHDFYMFRNVETNEINVIYERNHGGYGVIQPRPTTQDQSLEPLAEKNGHSGTGHHHHNNGHHTKGHTSKTHADRH